MLPSRRLAFAALLAFASAATPACRSTPRAGHAHTEPPTPSRPNLVVIYCDDMGWGDAPGFAVAGHEPPAYTREMPNLSRLAREGATRERLDELKLGRLRALVREILPHNRFYAAKLARVPHDLASLDDLAAGPFSTEEELVAVVPKRHWIAWSHWLIEHGRAVCRARRPDCGRCVLERLCRKVGVERPGAE